MNGTLNDSDWQDEINKAISAVQAKNEVASNAHLPINKTIDHTLLKLDATDEQIDRLCDEARQYDFATVCVRPNYIARCIKSLVETDVKVATVIGFHEGTYSTEDKLEEARESIKAGAAELDVVVNWPDLKAKQYSKVFSELKAIRQASPPTIHLKLIFETSQLSHDEIVAACVLASAASFDYVKTSTGFLGHGAKTEHVRLMALCCQHLSKAGQARMKVKASGGVRSLQDARAMLDAGASRLGTSAGVAIAQQLRG